ncbi:MAG: hypothetical protein JW751_17285 [Polyangiaceae bacterium]|nr:hypothetical protein [Polyangiaceae bacterium]
MNELNEYVDGVLNLSGFESEVAAATAPRRGAVHPSRGRIELGQAKSAFAIALHMHQPLIPAGGSNLRTAALISNLKHMDDNPGIGDNHNAPVFRWCYQRMGEFVPALIREGKNPRVMLEYSGTLLYGLRQMGAHDVLDSLRGITVDPEYAHAVEWLGCPWGHAVAPSTPAQDYRLHVRAWQHHFAALFGLEALGRVRGFSPAEMALPNHPDVAYEYVRTLKECGFEWLLVQEHTVEEPDTGHTPRRKHIPHRLVCRNSAGEEVSIVALVKTQGSDTKLVAQMQPYYEARSVGRVDLSDRTVPPLVVQIADGENGGVMMNEFPPKFHEVMRECSGSETPALNGTEYLDHLAALGVTERDFPVVQPLFQCRIWERFAPGDGPERLERTIEELRRTDGRFHMEGGSWTNNLSWVRGYENLLGPMDRLSARFAQVTAGSSPSETRYRNALFHLLTAQTSCYRYWGQGVWTDYGLEIIRRADEILSHDY